MKTKEIVIGAVVLAVLLFVALLLPIFRKPGPDFTVRHVKSVRSDDITTMTFEIKNHTAAPYIFFPFKLEVQNGNGWSQFQSFDVTKIYPNPALDPNGLASYTIDVTNLPDKSVVRFSIRLQKTLLGLGGFVRRAELKLEKHGSGPPGQGISLNPNDRNSKVFGKPSEVASEEWVETPK